MRTGEQAVYRFTYSKPKPALAPPPVIPPTTPRRIAEPVVTQPVKNQVFSSNNLLTHRSIDFSWESVEGASSYTLSILQPGSDVPLFTVKNITGNAYSFTDLPMLDRGAFSYTIEAIDAEALQMSTASGVFSVDIPPLTAPKTFSPGGAIEY
jgi:hypothetical protein